MILNFSFSRAICQRTALVLVTCFFAADSFYAQCYVDYTSSSVSNMTDCNRYFDEDMAYAYTQGIIYLNFHFILDSNGEGNFLPDGDNVQIANDEDNNGINIAHNILDRLNALTEELIVAPDVTSPAGADLPSCRRLPWRYEIYTEANNTEDIYDGIWFHNHSNYNSDVTVSYGPYIDEVAITSNYRKYGDKVLDVYFVEMSGIAQAGWAHETFGVGNGIFLFNTWKNYIDRMSQNPMMYSNHWHQAYVLNHEMGHTLSEQGGHVNNSNYFCADAATSYSNTNNAMHEEVYSWRTAWTQCQVNRMYKNFQTSPDREYYIPIDPCELNTTEPYIVDEDVVFETKITFNRDIILQDGASLTVLCTLNMPTSGKISVMPESKLIVDGGTITSGCDGETWAGTKVSGGNSDFDIKFTNSATIENTSSAAVSMFAPFPWPEIKGYGNGIIQADNTTFNNTKRIVELMAWQPSDNTSYIRDCFQYGGKWSITNWNCLGVEISDNEFHDITESSIVTETGQFFIEGNKFYSTKNDILFSHVSPGYGTFINDNEFHSSDTGIRCLGSTVAEHYITHNRFETEISDIFIDGDNNYRIEYNDLSANFGVVSINTGKHPNEVSANDFDGNIVGLLTQGNNYGYIFKKNCFNTVYTDSYILGQVAPVESDGVSGPANNCFTHQGNINNTTYDIIGSPTAFKYVEPNDHSNTCHDALKANSNVTRIFQGNQEDVCSYAGVDFSSSGNDNCNQIMDETALLGSISSLNSSISSVQSNTSLSSETKAWYTMSYNRCLKRAKWRLFEYYLRENEFTDARNVLSSDTTEDARIAIYTSYIFENDLEDASYYLSQLSSTGSAFNDFKWIQNINLNRLEYGPFFTINSQKLDTIELIATKTHIYAGYAKALYYVLTGEILSSNIPEDLEDYLEPRGLSNSNNPKEVNINPSPFSNILNISSIGYENNLRIIIYDMQGRSIIQKPIGSEEIIHTELWKKGMYLVVILDSGQIIERKKVVLIN